MTESFDSLKAALADRYRLDRELGRGGMAVVFLARDRRHDRPVAIKTLLPELATAVGHDRFLAEIRTAAQLHHPHILPLFDSGEAEGVLYYVMPYVAGESLRDRLDRERQLPIDEAVRIAREVADALAFAHEQGIVHRDIKPENILLADGHAVVADFGLARAVYRAASPKLTSSGIVLGTPLYMSPEQAAGEREVDGRSDIYSLGCVLFELVAGVPPFRAATAQALLSKHVSEDPPRLCGERRTCPAQVEMAVQRALAKAPADRFRTAREFAEALGRYTPPELRVPPPPPPRPVPRPWRTWAAAAGVVALVAAAGAWGVQRLRQAAPPDESRYVVLPFTAGGWGGGDAAAGAAEGAGVAERLASALGEWRGVEVVNDRLVREELGSPARLATLRTIEAAELARKLGAGRLVWGEHRRAGDTLYVQASVFGTDERGGGGGALRQETVAVSPSSDVLTAYRKLANALLRDGRELPWSGPDDRHAPSLDAWRAYDEGRAAAAAGDFDTAEGHLREAVTADDQHARARLWLARVQMWGGRPRPAWRGDAARAVQSRGYLDAGSRDAAEALLALAEGQFPEACNRYRRAAARDSLSFAAWFGLGECQFLDSVVVRDARSRSGYHFRSSFHDAARSYARALEHSPPVPAFVYARLARVLPVEMNVLRVGRLADGSDARFAAYPALNADTLAFFPYPLGEVMSASAAAIPATRARATTSNRATLRRLLEQWVRNSPQSFRAHEALAGLLETVGEVRSGPGSDMPAALTEVRRARALADTAEHLRLARSHVRLLVKAEEFTAAAALADTLLARWPGTTASDADVLVALAALTGRVRRMAALLQSVSSLPKYRVSLPGGGFAQPPGPLAEYVASVTAHAALGACTDTLHRFQERLADLTESYYVNAGERSEVRSALLRRPLSMAVPCLGARAVAGLDPAGDRLVRMQQALARGDRAGLRAQFDSVLLARAGDRPGDIAVDVTFQEAWLLSSAGDTARAVRHLDRTLDALSTLGSQIFNQPAQPAGLVRAMALRADLAAATGDAAAARRWARAVAALWAHADPELASTVGRMHGILGLDGRTP